MQSRRGGVFHGIARLLEELDYVLGVSRGGHPSSHQIHIQDGLENVPTAGY